MSAGAKGNTGTGIGGNPRSLFRDSPLQKSLDMISGIGACVCVCVSCVVWLLFMRSKVSVGGGRVEGMGGWLF